MAKDDKIFFQYVFENQNIIIKAENNVKKIVLQGFIALENIAILRGG